MNHIDYRDLPFQTNLFLDYMYDYEKVEKYFAGNFRDSNHISIAIEKAAKRNINRSALVEILLHQNQEYNDPKAIENIHMLENPNTVAIVTGQQVGLYSGPLYTVYKIITALKLAEKYKAEYPEYKFVPVFWLEAEDHDFLEINKIKIIDKQNNIFTHEYFQEGKPADKNYGAVGEIILDQFIETLNKNISSTLTLTEYHDSISALLNESYKNGSSILNSFCLFISKILKNSGLIFFNINSPDVKNLLRPIFEKEINEHPKTSELIINISAELEEIYHAQVKARSINLFMFHAKGRYPLDPSDYDYTLKGIRQKYTQIEMVEMLNTTPEVFSPNVILRPICQDYLLPTVCYIAGPSEIGYFAQFKPVYDFFNVEMPIIYPRASMTIIENKIQKILAKYNLQINDFFTKYEQVLRKVSEEVSSIKLDQIFNSIENDVNKTFDDLQNDTLKIDTTLISVIENSKGKIQHTYSILKEKLVEAQKRNNKTALDQIEKTILHVFPKNNLQERELNIIYFLNKYNMSVMNRIYEELDIELFNHQLMDL
jgi:bacillithiol synthase